jgi:hypothetical protein
VLSEPLLLVAGLLSPSDFVRVTSTAAAQVFNIYPRKGLIAPGSDADVIVLDPRVEHTLSAATHHSAIDTNIYEGMNVRGKVSGGAGEGGWGGDACPLCVATMPVGFRTKKGKIVGRGEGEMPVRAQLCGVAEGGGGVTVV